MTTLAALLISLAAIQPVSSLDNAVDAALGTAGLDQASARIIPSSVALFRESTHTNPLVGLAREGLWQWPAIASAYRSPLLDAVHQPEASLAACGRFLGLGVRRDLVKDALETASGRSLRPQALQIAMERMRQRGLFGGDLPSTDGVPAEVQRAAALVLEVALDTYDLRQAAFDGIGDLNVEMKRARPEALAGNPVEFRHSLETASKFDMAYLLAAAEDLARATELASVLVDNVPPTTKYDFKVATAWGDIELTGGTDDIHADRSVFLMVDTGGEDTYINLPANKSASNWLSVILDSHGNDKYLSEGDGAANPVRNRTDRSGARYGNGCASASYGVSLLWDSRGNDLYRSVSPAFGSSVFGVAYLMDREGDDTYDAYADSEGYATFGIGILEDMSGKDKYSVFHQGQGCGMTGGVGLLLDRKGDDVYSATDGPLDFPAAPDPDHNASFAQGAGVGLRMDLVNGKSMGGGVGVLLDSQGDDEYSCGVYGQGVGYWEGCGFLWDTEGKDKYTAVKYAQGSATQFGFGSLEDSSGADAYVLPGGQGLGFGQDFSVGQFLDKDGADVYTCGGESLGYGSLNGVGWFTDMAGDDNYLTKGRCLGDATESPAGSLREPFMTLGAFLDLGGRDTFLDYLTWAKNGARTTQWRRKGGSPSGAQLGLFYDR